ncbi:proteinase B [Entomophthora muscae]|uniref:Proteinase B n=1 Tax=Entomophthora muscae TaxID=34485 RepID=A0ACC2TJV0_9FUNG|nr:proteinase B [Entomophthora muscae]
MKSVVLFLIATQLHAAPEGNYIIKLKKRPSVLRAIDPLARMRTLLDQVDEASQEPTVYSGIGNMYSVSLSGDSVAEISKQSDVAYIEKDFAVRPEEIQESAGWHLSRVSHRRVLPKPEQKYIYESAGEGVTVYIVDSGINITHPDFEGRASHGKTFYGDDDLDWTGHGTFVAGLVGSKTFGTAKKAKLVAVKIFDSQGNSTGSSAIAAIDWVVENAKPGYSILNLSIGAARSRALNDAVDAAIRNNIAVVVAAGNENVDACTRSPASSKRVITVGSIGPDDIRSNFTSYGSCVDIFAPGERLPSTSKTGGISLATGTSASAPVVAGILANFLSEEPETSPQGLNLKLLLTATRNTIKELDTESPNRVAYNVITN